MSKFKSRLNTHISLIIILLSLLAIPANVKGAHSDAVLIHAIKVLSSGGGYTKDAVKNAQAKVIQNIKRLNGLRLEGQISNRAYQISHRIAWEANASALNNSSTPRVKVVPPKHPKPFNPGTDTDAIIVAINPNDSITLDDIKEFEKNHQKALRDHLRDLLGHEPPPGHIDMDTDPLPDPKSTTKSNHDKIAAHIRSNGGCPYSSQLAVRAEIKLRKGRTPTLKECSAYQKEMGQQIAKQLKLAKNCEKLEDILLHYWRAAKYGNRSFEISDSMKRHYLPNTPYEIEPYTVLDDALNKIGMDGRGPETRMAAIKVGGLVDQMVQKSSGLFIELNMKIAIENGLKSTAGWSAGNNIAHELISLPPSEAGVMIQQMERELGHEFTTRVVKEAKRLRGLNKTAESAGAKWLRRVGKAMIVYDALKRTYVVFKAEYEERPQKILEESSSFILGTAGATAGSAAGAAFGTLICPGPGTAVGAIFGLFWGIKGYMEGEAWGRKGGSWAASQLGVDQNVGQSQINKATTRLYNDLIKKGIPKDKAEEAAKLMHSGKLKEFQTLMANIRKVYVTNISEFIEGEDFTKEEKLMFYNCLCEGCGSLGSAYGPHEDGQPCTCGGALNSWGSPFRTDKKSAYYCFNRVIRVRYAKNQQNFDEMNKENKETEKHKALYEKMLEMAKKENAKGVEKKLQRVKQLMQKSETLIEATNLFNNIKGLLLKQDKTQTSSKLSDKLTFEANLKTVTGDFDGAIAYTKLAIEVQDGDPEKSSKIENLKKMRMAMELMKKLKKLKK